jgi:hypothetical protein
MYTTAAPPRYFVYAALVLNRGQLPFLKLPAAVCSLLYKTYVLSQPGDQPASRALQRLGQAIRHALSVCICVGYTSYALRMIWEHHTFLTAVWLTLANVWGVGLDLYADCAALVRLYQVQSRAGGRIISSRITGA